MSKYHKIFYPKNENHKSSTRNYRVLLRHKRVCKTVHDGILKTLEFLVFSLKTLDSLEFRDVYSKKANQEKQNKKSVTPQNIAV